MSEANTHNLSIITNRYATAFIELAEKHNLLDKFDADLALIKETLRQSKDLNDFLQHPIVNNNDKCDVIEKIFGADISNFSLNLVKLLIEKNRVFILSSLSSHYTELLNKKRNISKAQVITAVHIDDEVLNRVKDKLEKMFEKQIYIESNIDEDIIAGMIVKIGDKIIDGSIKTKIQKMKKQLI